MNFDKTNIIKHLIETAEYNYKKEFYIQCTDEFTEYWINKIEKLRKWIKKML